ncbi:MAG TPA: hypothetical protein VFS43_27520 [Polyangiaceae bacterium]|nr:hypothetical protein [Polyangiaceae bacterium]
MILGLVAVGALRPDAALHAPPEPGGRLRRLPSPGELARDEAVAWQATEAELYGRAQRVAFKACVARWRRGTGERRLRVVAMRCARGSVPVRVFFATDPGWDARAVLEGYADGRWSIEPCFRDGKQLLGLDEPSARAEAAVARRGGRRKARAGRAAERGADQERGREHAARAARRDRGGGGERRTRRSSWTSSIPAVQA